MDWSARLFTLAVAISACAPRASPAPSAPASSSKPAPKPDEIDPALEAKLAEYRRVRDWRNTAFVTGMPAGELVVKASRAITKKAKPPRPTSVRAYQWMHDGCKSKSAFGMPFRADGSLCEGVVGASVVLDENERDVVFRLVTGADQAIVSGKSRAVVACDFDPHHAFVFFDEHGAPIARVEPCFECGQMLWEPASRPEELGRWEPLVMTDDERNTLEGIFDRHGLAAWAFDDRTAEYARVRAYEKKTYGPPLTPRGEARKAARLALSPPVDREVSPKHASKKDRERLCSWYADEIATNGDHMQSTGWECTNKDTYVFALEEGDCEKSLAKCDVKTREIEDCLRAFARGPEAVCTPGGSTFPPACGGHRECVPGLR